MTSFGTRATRAAATTVAALACSLLTAPTAHATTTQTIPVIRVSMTNAGMHLSGPTTRRAGRVTFVARSSGREHEFQLFKLRPGYTLARMIHDTHAADGGDMTALRRVVRGVNFLGGLDMFDGETASTTETLYAGTYYVDDSDGALRRQDLQQIHVYGAPVTRPFPAVEGIITAANMRWRLSSTVMPARGNILVRNHSEDPHFLLLAPVKPGTTRAQIGAYFRSTGGRPDAPPPSFALPGPQIGTATLSPETQAVFRFNLKPGEYAMFCFFPDPDHGGEPHALMGMYNVVHLR